MTCGGGLGGGLEQADRISNNKPMIALGLVMMVGLGRNRIQKRNFDENPTNLIQPRPPFAIQIPEKFEFG
jgi:hypothetical protein